METQPLSYCYHPWEPSNLVLLASAKGLCRIELIGQEDAQRILSILSPKIKLIKDDKPFVGLCKQLDSYFSGKAVNWKMPLDIIAGTDFQRLVWAALRRIPYGKTITYGRLAQEIGRPAASRAVGAANGANPIPIVIPCHRVVAGNGKLGGYSGGLSIKQALLQLEGVLL